MGKVVVVEPVVKGFPAENYELVSYGITPETLSIEGPASVIEKINTLKTETISIDGRNESFNLPVKIELAEEKVVITGGNEEQFRGRIEKSLIIKSIAPVEIIMENSDSSMVYELEVHSGSLRVEAERTIIDFLDRENCSLYIDMQNVTSPGVYNLPVNARLPEMEGEIKITGIAPETIRVYVTRNRRY
jgi:YbbR domain-containing protein